MAQEQKYEWNTFLGTGASHLALVDNTRRWVFKILLESDVAKRYPHEDIDRSVRLFNEINQPFGLHAKKLLAQKIPADMSIHKTPTYEDPNLVDGVLVPFIKGRQPTDDENFDWVLDIYQRTGRILIDATAIGNCITREDGTTVCIDTDLGLKFERRLDQQKQIGLEKQVWAPRASFASSETWRSLGPKLHDACLKDAEKIHEYPRTTKGIEALLCLQSERPDIRDVNFLHNEEMLHLFASGYQELFPDGYPQKNEVQTSSDNVVRVQNFLRQNFPINLASLKTSCYKLLTDHLAMEQLEGAEDFKECGIHCAEVMQGITNAATDVDVVRCIQHLRSEHQIQEKFPRLDSVLKHCLVIADSLSIALNRQSLLETAQFFLPYVYGRTNIRYAISVHTLDLLKILAMIWLPVLLLDILNHNISPNQMLTVGVVGFFLFVVPMLKETQLLHLSDNVVTNFTIDLLQAKLNAHVPGQNISHTTITLEYGEDISSFIKKTFGELCSAYLALFGFGIAITVKDRLVGGMAIGGLLTYFAYVYYFLTPKYHRAYKTHLTENSRLIERVLDYFKYGDMINRYDHGDEARSIVTALLKDVHRITNKKNSYDLQTERVGLLIASTVFMIGIIYWLGTYQQSPQSMPDYILLFSYLLSFAIGMAQTSPLMSQVLSSAERVQRLTQHSMWTNKTRRANTEHTIILQSYDVTFEGVWYRDPRSGQLVDDLSLHIEDRAFYAVISDDQDLLSAIVKLLCREAHPIAGKIKLGKTSVAEIEEHSLARTLAVVDSKDEFIDGLSWFDTIKYGNKQASDTEVFNAAIAAGLVGSDENIVTLKTRFISPEEGNTPFQKRCLAIARVVLKGGHCLILNNPTAGLSYDDEQRVLDILIQLSSCITTILFTDKCYLLGDYTHKITYLEKGQIIECDTYSQLINDKSYFYNKLQREKQVLRKFYETEAPLFGVASIFDITSEDNVSPIKNNFRPHGHYHQKNINVSLIKNNFRPHNHGQQENIRDDDESIRSESGYDSDRQSVRSESELLHVTNFKRWGGIK